MQAYISICFERLSTAGCCLGKLIARYYKSTKGQLSRFIWKQILVYKAAVSSKNLRQEVELMTRKSFLKPQHQLWLKPSTVWANFLLDVIKGVAVSICVIQLFIFHTWPVLRRVKEDAS